jgi:hypothetical protein
MSIADEDIVAGAALREDWRYILLEWLDECDETDRFHRLLNIYYRCLHDGEHPVEEALYDATFPRYF